MQRKKRTKSKLVKQFMNFLLAIALGISLLQLPQLSKEVKAENVIPTMESNLKKWQEAITWIRIGTLVKKL